MANLGTTFDATTIEPAKAYEVLPPGKYLAQIVNSETRVTKDGMGQYLWLEIDVLDGPHKGRKLFDRLNLVNANPQTVEIAQRTLSAICHATGRMQVQDSEELHLIPFIADVQVQPPKNGYGESNKVRYLPLDARRPRRRTPRPARTAPRRRRRPSRPARQPRASPRRPGSVRREVSATATPPPARRPNMNGGGALPRISRRHPWTSPSYGNCLRPAARRAPGLPPSTTTSPRSAPRSPLQICSGRRSRKPIDPELVPPRQDRAAPSAARAGRAAAAYGHAAREPRTALKDQVIAVLRERHDEASWADVMDEAHRRLDGEVP